MYITNRVKYFELVATWHQQQQRWRQRDAQVRNENGFSWDTKILCAWIARVDADADVD